MLSTTFAALFFALPALGLELNHVGLRRDYATPCDVNSKAPCSCPAGTTFSNSTTYGFIGAPASDILSVIGDCRLYRYLSVIKMIADGADRLLPSVA